MHIAHKQYLNTKINLTYFIQIRRIPSISSRFRKIIDFKVRVFDGQNFCCLLAISQISVSYHSYVPRILYFVCMCRNLLSYDSQFSAIYFSHDILAPFQIPSNSTELALKRISLNIINLEHSKNMP